MEIGLELEELTGFEAAQLGAAICKRKKRWPQFPILFVGGYARLLSPFQPGVGGATEGLAVGSETRPFIPSEGKTPVRIGIGRVATAGSKVDAPCRCLVAGPGQFSQHGRAAQIDNTRNVAGKGSRPRAKNLELGDFPFALRRLEHEDLHGLGRQLKVEDRVRVL